jgi:hypothetical protein
VLSRTRFGRDRSGNLKIFHSYRPANGRLNERVCHVACASRYSAGISISG